MIRSCTKVKNIKYNRGYRNISAHFLETKKNHQTNKRREVRVCGVPTTERLNLNWMLYQFKANCLPQVIWANVWDQTVSGVLSAAMLLNFLRFAVILISPHVRVCSLAYVLSAILSVSFVRSFVCLLPNQFQCVEFSQFLSFVWSFFAFGSRVIVNIHNLSAN